VGKLVRAPVVIGLLLLLGTQMADARHYRFHYRHWGHGLRYGGATAPPDPAANTPSSSPRSGPGIRVLGRPFPPPDWQLQPVDPQHTGRRYRSPDGAASLAFYASRAGRESASEHLKSIAFVDGEDVLRLAGTQGELVVTGTKQQRMFVRKARLACGGRDWHHVVVEFPISAQRDYARVVEQALGALDRADDDGCTAPVSSNGPAGAGATQQTTAQTPPQPSGPDEVPSAAPPSPSGSRSGEP
jgi:hypothetical protein